MSYNITHIDVLLCENATIAVADLRRFAKEFELPESDFISELLKGLKPVKCPKCKALITDGAKFCAGCGKEAPAQAARVPIDPKRFWWCHSGSGNSYEDTFVKKVLPAIQGKLEFVACWEGGDSLSGFTVHDGVVTECDVEYKLVPSKE